MIHPGLIKRLKENKGRFVSGEKIAYEIGITRTAVWKQIQKLKEMGYMIDSHPKKGYRILSAPDLLIPAEIIPNLKTKWLAKNIYHFFRIDSTNKKAFSYAINGAEHGTVIIAESQTKGKGRLQRGWFSPAGYNLYTSIILRPPFLPNQSTILTFLSAVAVAKAIQFSTNLNPLIKWPNDILIRRKKVSGILNEMRSETDKVDFVVLGIGVNINIPIDLLPLELKDKATSLSIELDKKIDRVSFTCSLFENIEKLYDILLKQGTEKILSLWRERAKIEGKELEVISLNNEIISGKAIGVDNTGALLIKKKNGKIVKVIAGDVTIKKLDLGENL
ncbi:MAG: biotin--[acetyl-CoA-carboxylase] ligase [Deltaproteobacteria bacterium]|nr:biotin--[acetyl-CoA-carboxylase] ligase [Deltaproteobacteria bacterium]